jgi:large subunit ribosomal protein L6
VRGPRGAVARYLSPEIQITQQDGEVRVTRPSDDRTHRALHGLTRALLNNMITGVTTGFRKQMEVQGVGYRAELQGTRLLLNVGYSHPVAVTPPRGINLSVDRAGRVIIVEGIDKELVGQVAANIRGVRQPEPYKGKGIRYTGERVIQKAGKTGKVGKGK